jgi:uncharacterized caspase-like protein
MKTLFCAALTILALTLPVEAAERRIALVVGNANYQTGSLPTPANDAGLVAQTLQAAGFDVAGARDLDQESLRRAFRDFLDKASSSGPDAVVYIYLSGYGCSWRARTISFRSMRELRATPAYQPKRSDSLTT